MLFQQRQTINAKFALDCQVFGSQKPKIALPKSEIAFANLKTGFAEFETGFADSEMGFAELEIALSNRETGFPTREMPLSNREIALPKSETVLPKHQNCPQAKLFYPFAAHNLLNRQPESKLGKLKLCIRKAICKFPPRTALSKRF